MSSSLCPSVSHLIAATLILLFSASSANADTPVAADSLPSSWTYLPEKYMEVPGGEADIWWKRFSDPLLDSLINMGIERNYDIAMARRRQEIARAVMNQTRSAWYPQLSLSAGWQMMRESGATSRATPATIPTQSYFNAGISASWEIDLFGKIASGVKARKAAYNASRAEYTGTMVSMAAQIASTYFTLRSYQRLLQIAKVHCERQLSIVRIAEARFEATLASKLDVAEAKQTYYSTLATIPQLESSIATTINSLGILVGNFPPEAKMLLEQPAPLPNWKVAVETGVPADLLRRRPDIIEAEMNLAEAAAEVGIAKKDFLPTLTIEGNVGTSARRLGDTFTGPSLSWSVVPTLSWTIFDGFSRKYQLIQARETMQNAIDNYNLTVLNAVGETENSFTTYDSALRHIEIIEQLCAQNEEALRLSIERYKDSLSPMSDVVNAQMNALSGESSLIQAQETALNALVSLYEALGGGIYLDPSAYGLQE